MTTHVTNAKPLDPHALRDAFPVLQLKVHRDRDLVYFDNAASTQRPTPVIEAMDHCYRESYANVHRGMHWLSEAASRLYEEARVCTQRFVGAARPEEVIFTGGTTLSLNTVARSWGDWCVRRDDEILLTMMEHHSNIVPWQQLAARTGAQCRFIELTPDGQLDLDDLARKLTSRTRVLAVSAVSNTLGTINPVAKLAEMAHEAGAVIVVDAAQHVPHAETDVRAWDADFVAFSGHKLLGPSGVGVLYGKHELLAEMPPFLGGGSMIKSVTVDGFVPGDLPARFEAGTPPIVEAVGLAAAIDWLQANVAMDALLVHEQKLAGHARKRMTTEIEGIRLLGPAAERTCGIVTFVIDGCAAQDIAVFLDLQGIAIRAGHHCTMPLHKHYGLAASCRASFYLYNTVEEVDYFVDSLKSVVEKLR